MNVEQVTELLATMGHANASKRAEYIVKGMKKASSPRNYLTMSLWNARIEAHPSSKESQQKARGAKLREATLARRQRVASALSRVEELAAEAARLLVLWRQERPEFQDQWDACLASLLENEWAPAMAARLGVKRDVLFQRKRRGMTRLLREHPHLAPAFRRVGRRIDEIETLGLNDLFFLSTSQPTRSLIVMENIIKIVKLLGGICGKVCASTLLDLERQIPGGEVVARVRIDLKGKSSVKGWEQVGYDPGIYEIAWDQRKGQLRKIDMGGGYEELGLVHGDHREDGWYGNLVYTKVIRWEFDGITVELFCDGSEADSVEER